MLIGQRLRDLREEKELSQGDIEERTGLLRCTSRVENGHTVPSIETLEKYARALELPMYRFFYEGEPPPKKPKLPASKAEPEWGAGRGGEPAARATPFGQGVLPNGRPAARASAGNGSVDGSTERITGCSFEQTVRTQLTVDGRESRFETGGAHYEPCGRGGGSCCVRGSRCCRNASDSPTL